MDRIFSGAFGYVHTVVDAFGERATLLRMQGDGRFSEESTRLARLSTVAREGVARVAGGPLSSKEPTVLRRREERLVGALSPIGLHGAPRPGIDRLVVCDREYRIDAVEELRVGDAIVAFRLECARS